MNKTELFANRGIKSTRVSSKGIICQYDALDLVSSMRAKCADIVFLDPPFNLGKDYGFRAVLEDADEVTYLEYLRSLIEESARVLRPGGSLFLYHVPRVALALGPALGSVLKFRHWIAVAMKNGFVRGDALYPAHYALLHFTKGAPRVAKRPRLQPSRCRHCGELIKNYGGYTEIILDRGINLSDFWDDLSPVRHRSTKHRKANELPVRLTDRVVEIAGSDGGLLLDPFSGTGTSLVSAQTHGMRFVGNDLHEENVKLSVSRLNATVNRRQSGRAASSSTPTPAVRR